MKKFLLTIAILFTAAVLAPKAQAADFAFTFDGQDFSVPAQTLNSWKGTSILASKNLLLNQGLSATDVFAKFTGKKTSTVSASVRYHYQANKIFDYIKELSATVDIASSEPVLKMENNRVTEFTQPQEGRRVDLRQSTLDALAALERGRTTAELTVAKTSPQTSLFQLNGLGINELIAEGTSNFAGSPNNRRHNIEVGLEKMKGVIIQKGEEFSFNKYLGEVSKEAGFLPELVIKRTGTVPELGGGLCQVSSTVFRAAMQAGLKITERRNHAYAVQYYAPQGTDATIYPGVVDLKFVNDTPGAILVWPYLKDKNTLVFDFYGTKDDRKVTLEKPLQWDRKADGSMKASWTREIFQNGTTTTDTFKSNYASPNLYHKTEEFATTTTTPATSAPPTSPSETTTQQ